MAYQKADYVYVIVVTLLFIFQLYSYLTRNRDVLLSILFPMAIIFTFIIGVKRMFNKKALKEEEGIDETTEGETTFRILFIILNTITFIIYIMYMINVPAVAFRDIKLTDGLVYRETNKSGEFRPLPVCSNPELVGINAPDKVDLVRSGSMNPNARSSPNKTPNEIDFNGSRYRLLDEATYDFATMNKQRL